MSAEICLPSASAREKPKVASAAGLNSTTSPASFVTITQSSDERITDARIASQDGLLASSSCKGGHSGVPGRNAGRPTNKDGDNDKFRQEPGPSMPGKTGKCVGGKEVSC